MRVLSAILVVLAALAARPAAAGADLAAARVPVSAFARPSLGLDPSQLHVSTMFAVGSGFGGSGALSVTSFSYQFRAPLWMQVSLGNTLGTSAGRGGSGGTFLEGVSLAWRPTPSMRLDFQYRDFRSPLQYPAYPARFSPFREY